MTYQILMLGTPWNEADIDNMLKELPDVKRVTIDTIDKDSPLLILYYGNSTADVNVEKSSEKLIKDAIDCHNIQPVTKEADEFMTMIPENLRSINGFFLKKDDNYSIQRLKNFIVSYFGLINSNRKVFISYCRGDIENLAQKIFDELVRSKYHPFLDSYSINTGVDFQEYLCHELVDSDIIILLDTPNFNSRPYCMQEFNIANQERIPVLDIRFKIDTQSNSHFFCDYWETDISCKDANENEKLVGEILGRMEKCMVRAYQFKKKHILDEFDAKYKRFGKNVVEQYGFLSCDQTHECFYPLTRIPSAKDLYDVNEKFNTTPFFSSYKKQILYNGNYCRPDIQEKLKWLNEHLPIGTFNITK